jgi:uncharacterized protein YybS (DUF2232 family)
MMYQLRALHEGAVLLSRLVCVIEKLDIFGSNASQVLCSTSARPMGHVMVLKKKRKGGLVPVLIIVFSHLNTYFCLTL